MVTWSELISIDRNWSALGIDLWNPKDLGHFWLGYIRMLGHLQLSAHLTNFEVLGLSLTCFKCYLDIWTMTIESVPHPLSWKGHWYFTNQQVSLNLKEFTKEITPRIWNGNKHIPTYNRTAFWRQYFKGGDCFQTETLGLLSEGNCIQSCRNQLK